jgi:hypothetical protein
LSDTITVIARGYGEESMGEIKSTLDLVMKKTEHLSLSAEERQKR